jgi:hypothetical protein
MIVKRVPGGTRAHGNTRTRALARVLYPTGRMLAASGPHPGRVTGPRPLPDLYWWLLLMKAKLNRTNGPNPTIWDLYK